MAYTGVGSGVVSVLLLLATLSAQAQPFRKRSLPDKEYEHITTLYQLGQFYEQEPAGGPDRLGREALQSARRTGNKAAQARALRLLGHNSRLAGELDSAVSQYRQAGRLLDELTRTARPDGSAGAAARQDYLYNFVDLGVCYEHMGLYGIALKTYQSGLSKAEAQQDSLLIGILYDNIGMLHHRLNDWVKAFEYVQQATPLYPAANPVAYSNHLVNLAHLYYDIGDHRSALENVKKAVALKKATGERRTLSNAFTLLGNIYRRQQHYANAVETLQEGLLLARRAGDRRLMAESYEGLARTFLSMKEHEPALQYVDRSIELAQQARLPYLQQELRELLWQILEQKGETARAYDAYRRYVALRDSVVGLEKQRLLTELEYQFENEKKGQRIQFLARENLLQQEKLRQEAQLHQLLVKEYALQNENLDKERLLRATLDRENHKQQQQLAQEVRLRESLLRENKLKQAHLLHEKQMRLYWLFVSVLVALLALVALALYVRQRRANKIIRQQSEDLRYLMKEVHHRVKNNLQVVSSLLRLQSNVLTDPGAIEAIESSEKRIFTIAVVHEKLYQSDNIRRVSVKTYLEDLLFNIRDHYAGLNTRVEVQVLDYVGLAIPLDTAVPIGLIVNELATNSFKYAFQRGQPGQLNVIIERHVSGEIMLRVRDNGPGLPANTMPINATTLGMRLVNALSKQIRGSLEYRPNNGAEFSLRFRAA